MRADAVAKRADILTAAEALIAADGVDVPYSRIAGEAGVGIGTLYRHFPTRGELVAAVAESVFGRVTVVVDRATARFDADPEQGWEGYLREMIGLRLGAIIPPLATISGGTELPQELAALRLEAARRVARLVERAQAAGLVRADVQPMSLQLVLGLLTRPVPDVGVPELQEPADWMVDVLVRGLRP